MDAPPGTGPTEYVIRLGCQLEPGAAVWFEGLTITNLAGGQSLLCGPVRDQAALHGLLARIRDLGLPLISVTPRTPDAQSPDGPAGPAATHHTEAL